MEESLSNIRFAIEHGGAEQLIAPIEKQRIPPVYMVEYGLFRCLVYATREGETEPELELVTYNLSKD